MKCKIVFGLKALLTEGSSSRSGGQRREGPSSHCAIPTPQLPDPGKVCELLDPNLGAIRIKKQVRPRRAHNPDWKGSFSWEGGDGKKGDIMQLPCVLIPAVPHPGQMPPAACFCL